MTKKIKISALFLLLFLIVCFATYQTYSYLTDSKSVSYEFEIGEVNGEVNVTGAENVETEVINNDLVYIHYIDDFITNKYGLLDKVASQIKVDIAINNDFNTRVKIMLPELTDLEGLVYLVIDDTDATKDLEIKLQILNGKLQYGYLADGATSVTSWTDLLDISSLNASSNNETFRTLINNYNKEKLVNLYEDNKYKTGNMNFRVLLWGDYYSLSNTNKSQYLDRSYQFTLTAKVIQAIDDYGGELDYEND